MKRVIRRGVFETNSSSMHSIVVTKNELTNDNHDDYFHVWGYSNKIHFWHGDIEFDRSPFEVLVTARDKLRYAYASFFGYEAREHVDEDGNPDDELRERMESFDSVVASVFDGYTGMDYYDSLNDDEWGYVDHESSSLLRDFLNKEDISLEEFLRNPKYIVVIDGDEYQVFKSMKEANLINKDNLVMETYGWGDPIIYGRKDDANGRDSGV